MKSEISQNRTFLMGLAMISIILFHIGWFQSPIYISFLFHLYGHWGVDLFLFLSGFGCVYALNKYTTTVFWRKRLIRIFPTCLLAGILIYSIDCFLHAELTLTYLPVRLLSLHRWYIQVILVCYFLCPLAYAVLNRYKVVGLLMMCMGAIILEMLMPRLDVWKFDWVFMRVPVFLIGMYVAMFDIKMTLWQYIVSALCLVIAVYIRFKGGFHVLRWAYFLAAAMPFICDTLCRLRNFCIKIKVYRVIEIFGAYSLEIYLIHEYFIWALTAADVPVWSKSVALIIVVSVLSYAVKLTTDFMRSHHCFLNVTK